MANEFKISERKNPGNFVNGVAAPINGRRVAGQELTVSTEVESAVFNASTDYIKLQTTIDAFYLIGTSPTAAANSTSEFLPVGAIVQESVETGESISIIAAT